MGKGVRLGTKAFRRMSNSVRRLENQSFNTVRNRVGIQHDDIRWLSVRNDSAEDGPQFGAAAVVDVEEIEGESILIVERPSATFHRDIIILGPEGVPGTDNEDGLSNTGLATYTPDFVLFGGLGPDNGAGLGPKPDEWALFEGYPQCALCQGVFDEDNSLMLATIELIKECWGKWDADVAKGATGTVLISTGNGEWTDSTITLENVTNVPADALANDLVNVGWMHGKPEGYPREC